MLQPSPILQRLPHESPTPLRVSDACSFRLQSFPHCLSRSDTTVVRAANGLLHRGGGKSQPGGGAGGRSTVVIFSSLSLCLSISSLSLHTRLSEGPVLAFSHLVMYNSMTVPLVRGCPYITFVFSHSSNPQFSTTHAVLQLVPSEDCTKHRLVFNNGQTWLIYSSEPLALSKDLRVTRAFKGVIRVALAPPKISMSEAILDRFSSAVYPIEGHATMSASFQLTYEWKKHGWGALLMLSLPMHRDIMSSPSSDNTFRALAYKSMDGDMHGVVGDSWVLKETPISVGWLPKPLGRRFGN